MDIGYAVLDRSKNATDDFDRWTRGTGLIAPTNIIAHEHEGDWQASYGEQVQSAQ